MILCRYICGGVHGAHNTSALYVLRCVARGLSMVKAQQEEERRLREEELRLKVQREQYIYII